MTYAELTVGAALSYPHLPRYKSCLHLEEVAGAVAVKRWGRRVLTKTVGPVARHVAFV